MVISRGNEPFMIIPCSLLKYIEILMKINWQLKAKVVGGMLSKALRCNYDEFQQLKNMKENSAAQYEKLILTHQKSRANLEKNHSKSIKRVQKSASGDNVDVVTEQKVEMERLVKDQERNVSSLNHRVKDL